MERNLSSVATWMKTARAEGSSTMTGSASGNAELRPGWCAGAAAPEQVVCVVAFGRLASCGRRVVSSVRFFCLGFPYKQNII